MSTTFSIALENEPVAATLSQSEIIEAIQALTEAEKIALIKIAKLFARKTAFGHDDLLQEAMCRVLSGCRSFPRGSPLVSFLASVMRSIAWQWRSAHHETAGDVPDPRCGEAPTIASIDAAKIVALFADDPIAQKIVVGMMEGARGEELQRLTGLGKVEYESKRRKIRRRIEKLAE
jgi:DNA-directed RNA polymerase specialized sigma24 family protein